MDQTPLRFASRGRGFAAKQCEGARTPAMPARGRGCAAEQCEGVRSPALPARGRGFAALQDSGLRMRWTPRFPSTLNPVPSLRPQSGPSTSICSLGAQRPSTLFPQSVPSARSAPPHSILFPRRAAPLHTQPSDRFQSGQHQRTIVTDPWKFFPSERLRT